MNADFVPFELAVKLKEKGFREKCFAYYTSYSGTLHYNEIKDAIPSRVLNIIDFGKRYNDFIDNNLDTPTISQVLKWLREEKKIHISIDIWGRTWGYDILNLPFGNSLHWTAYDENINNYEQAALAGIEYVLDELI